MLDKLVSGLDFQARALVLRSERQRVIASNIANVDTPGFVARDYQFGEALRNATSHQGSASISMAQGSSDRRHLSLSTVGALGGSLGGSTQQMGYSVPSQPNMDNNTVDLDRERANFVDNTVRYEAALRFINGQSKTMLSAIQGQ